MVSLAVVKNSSATTKGSQGASRMTRSGGLVGVVGNASTPELRSQYVFAVAGGRESRPRTCGALRAMDCIERHRRRGDVAGALREIDGADLGGRGNRG